jgi:DNA-binding NarL/FixJ family response regulator
MNNRNSALKVVIVDDHFLFPLALQTVIQQYAFLNTVAILSSGSEMVAKMNELAPDIIFMDVIMPIMDGFTATQLISKKYPDTKIVAITTSDEGRHVKRMMEAGAWGYITKNSDKKAYDELFGRILSDKKYISPDAAINYTILMNESPGESGSVEPNITEREIEIIRFVAKGYSDKQIAEVLNLSHRTIDAHKQKVMQKLGTRKATEMVAIAYRMNLL